MRPGPRRGARRCRRPARGSLARLRPDAPRIGSDGHLLSVFPGSAAIGAPELALAIPAPTHIEPHVERVTLNPALVGTARDLLVVATGADKASVIGGAFGPSGDPRTLPARLAVRAGATWILDEAAAAEMPGR